jgi:hypothetical protein
MTVLNPDIPFPYPGPLLIACMEGMPRYPFVVECGSGHGSTPTLLALTKAREGTLVSFEESQDWVDRVRARLAPMHLNWYTEDMVRSLDELAIVPDMVFVDNAPFRIVKNSYRRNVIEWCRQAGVRMVVVHDTEPDPPNRRFDYGYDTALAGWAYRADWAAPHPDEPWATVVSDVMRLDWLGGMVPLVDGQWDN